METTLLTIEEFERLPDDGSRMELVRTVYRSRDDVRWVTGDGEIEGEPALPGFRLKLSEIFAD